MVEYLYILQIDDNNIYKIGKINKNDISTISNNKLLIIIICFNCDYVLTKFKKKYNEYLYDNSNDLFSGNYNYMIKDIYNLIYNDNYTTCNECEKIYDEYDEYDKWWLKKHNMKSFT